MVTGIENNFHVVVAGLLMRAGRELLVHRSPTRQWYPDCWDLPGGHVEVNETPAAALRRELDRWSRCNHETRRPHDAKRRRPSPQVDPLAGLVERSSQVLDEAELVAFRVGHAHADHLRRVSRIAGPRSDVDVIHVDVEVQTHLATLGLGYPLKHWRGTGSSREPTAAQPGPWCSTEIDRLRSVLQNAASESGSAQSIVMPRRLFHGGVLGFTTSVEAHAVVVVDTKSIMTSWNDGDVQLFGHASPHSTCVRRTGRGCIGRWRPPRITDLAAGLPVLCGDGCGRELAGRLVALSDGLGTAIRASPIYRQDGFTGVRPFPAAGPASPA